MKKSRLMIAGSVIGLALGSAVPSFAQSQDVNETVAPADEEDAGAPILVTGSRIVQPNLTSANPVTVVSGEEFFETGSLSVGDLLNDLPQLRNTYSQQNSTRFLGTRGINLLDLRGLGSQRTLVLVNGRRHVAGDILVNGVSPDVNTIPTDLIERVDVVTGGASAVYGSDAVAGVVNFILKDDYEGIQLRGQAGVSTRKDAGNQYASLLAGKNFADGRGNIAVNLEYAHTSPYYGSGGRGLRQTDGFVIVDTDPAGALNGGDDVKDRIFYRDIRSSTISLGGQVGVRYPNTAAAPCGLDAVGSSFTCAFLFQPDGSLVNQTGLRVGLGPNGNFVGGNGTTSREGQLLTITPDLKRYSANLTGKFEISPAFELFGEAKYTRTEAFGSQSGPFFSQGTTLGDGVRVLAFQDRSFAAPTASLVDVPGTAIIGSPNAFNVNREGIRLDNPYLSAAARTQLTAQFNAAINANVNPNTGGAFATTGVNAPTAQANRAALLAQVANGSFRFSLRRNYVDLGIRDEKIVRETVRVVGGIRGQFNDDWRYELSANYGEHNETNRIANNINRQRFLLANDTVRNGAGQIVCRSQVDPTLAGADRGGNPAQLAADIAACVPLNPFGQGSVSQAARDYLTIDSSAEGKITQLNLLGYVSGDTSGFFNLPGGPVSFSAGGEYRRETNFYDLDDLTQAGYAFYNAIPSFTAPAFEVKEAYGEINLPILSDTPFFEELSIRGSGRVSDYKGSVGTVYAYGGEAIWRPVQDLTFRGAYSRSVRSPNLSELFSSQSQNFAPAPADPCSARNIGAGSATRSANCTADGRPAGYDFVYTSSLEIVSGGNPNLTEETSDSYTAGVLIQPRWVPGLSLSFDYYDIAVNNVITATGSAQQILNLCYDSPTLNNPFCGLFQRAGAGGGPRGEEAFRVLEGSLLQSTANFAKLLVRGFDVNANYRTDLSFGTLNLGAVWTHQIRNESYTNPADPTFVNVFVGELNDPKDQVNFNASLKVGNVTVGYEMRWLDSMFLNTFEDYNSVNGQPPQNIDYAPIVKYPDVFYHDIRLGLDINEKFNFYAGMDNVTDRLPPFGLTGVGAGSGIYDVRGRYMYAGFVAKF